MFKYNKNKIKIKTPTGYQNFAGINRTKKRRDMLKIITTNNEIDVTSDHKIKNIDNIFKYARDLKIGDKLLSNKEFYEITQIEKYIDDCYVYDLVGVDNGNEYYTNNIISHNCSFIGSSFTLLSADSLSKLSKKIPIIEDYLYPDVKLYKEFNEDSIYIATLDSSKTVGKTDAENDYLCFNILELGKNKIEQVLTYRVNDIHYTDMSRIIYEIGEEFGFPWTVIENNEGAGQSIADTLKDVLEYPNIYCDPLHDGEIAGIRTKVNNRMIGLQSLKKLIDSDLFIINNDDTIDEFFTFIKIGKKYQAAVNSTDDCIMSLNLLMYFLMDDLNELEITLKDYLEDTVNIIKDNVKDDIDFFIGMTQEEVDSRWLLEGKDFNPS